MINGIYNFMVAHPLLFWGCYTALSGCWSAYAGSLRAPTAQSSQAYVSWFAICNSLAFNFSRIAPPKVENSPNFQAALNQQQRQSGQGETVVQLPTKP
jgi:hypothetical protein